MSERPPRWMRFVALFGALFFTAPFIPGVKGDMFLIAPLVVAGIGELLFRIYLDPLEEDESND